MPSRHQPHDEDDDDWEAPEDDDWSEGDEEPTVECPHCGREIMEDIAQCPYCERYLSRDDAPTKHRPWWIIVAVLACIYVIVRSSIGW